MGVREICSNDFATHLTFISAELNRVVGVLVDRKGKVNSVIIGDSEKLFLPDIGRTRGGAKRFRGLRLIRTLLGPGEKLNDDDFADLSKLRLDLVVGISIAMGGYPGPTEWAHLLPVNPAGKLWEVQSAPHPSQIDLRFDLFIAELESEFSRKAEVKEVVGGQPAILVYVSIDGGRDPDAGIPELEELCRTAGVEVIEKVTQNRSKMHPKFGLGTGRLDELMLMAVQRDIDLIIFGQDLSPAQLRHITDTTDCKVIDRTQLILDIFAQHASSKDGRLQVELAQLKYNLPRLSGKGTSMSRLMGGIGGRGPGETKLEIDRRRARDRIHRLQKDLEKLSAQRLLQRKKRLKNNTIVSIVGYTNAGKSTLLNQLTRSDVLSEDQLFATLTPTSRQFFLPKVKEVVLTDTVGFIHDLPKDLVVAFKATLEELEHSSIFLHVVDVSTDRFEERIEAVNRILHDLDLNQKQILVFNKIDRLERNDAESKAKLWGAIPISALEKQRPENLLEKVEDLLERTTS